MQEVYAWDDNPDSLLLIEWRSDKEKLSFDGWGGTPPDPTPYPFVINGYFKMNGKMGEGIISYEGRSAHFVCIAPDGTDYNDILSKVNK